MTTIKVLHIVKSLGRGGAETLLLQTLKQHNKNQFKFFIIYFLPWKNELVKELEDEGAVVINLEAKNNFQILLKANIIKHFVKINNINIVHSHLPWAGIVARISLLKNTTCKLIYSEHNIQERYHWITKTINKLTYKYQKKVIAVSKSVEDSIYKNISPNINTQVIFNGVDTDYFIKNLSPKNELKQNLGIDSQSIIIGNICVFRSQKRLKTWVDIFELVHKKNPHTIGLLVGAGILFDEIKDYIKLKKLDNKIILTGLKPNAKDYFNIINIFLLSSEFEGLPIALLEAMSMNCIPVVTNAGGVKEVIVHQQNGLMVDVNEPLQLVEELNKILNDFELGKVIFNKTRETVVNHFSIKNTTKQIEELYTSLV